MTDIIRPTYRIWIFDELPVKDPINESFDVHVHLENGEHYFAVFMTVEWVRQLLKDKREWLEQHPDNPDAELPYLAWGANSDLVIVESLSEEILVSTIDDLMKNGDFYDVFDGPLRNDDEDDDEPST